MHESRTLIRVWLLLLGLTTISVLLAETGEFSLLSASLVCLVVAFKGRWIVDYFIGLRYANRAIRNVMLGYFYVLPALIILGMLFPQVVVKLTTLG